MKILATFLIIASAGGLLHAGQVTIKGSDTMVILAQRWAESYMRAHRDAVVQVSGGGSGTGVAALLSGAADIANCSRRFTAQEMASVVVSHGALPEEHIVAMDGVAIYVHESNPVDSFKLADLRVVFCGEVATWRRFSERDAPIVVYSREGNSGTYEFFQKMVLEGKDFGAKVQMMPGTAALVNAVARDPNGIGYGGIGYASGVRMVPVKRGSLGRPVLPSRETVWNGEYPLGRPLYCYTCPHPANPEATLFLTWAKSAQGQQVVEEVGYVPLSPK